MRRSPEVDSDAGGNARREGKGRSRLAFAAYEQIAGVLGALAFAALLGHFIEFDWRGALAQLFSVWDSTVRPTVKLLIDATVVPFFARCCGWHIDIPLIGRDYISVGIVLFLSMVRTLRHDIARLWKLLHSPLSIIDIIFLPIAVSILLALYLGLLLPLLILLWPLLLVINIIAMTPLYDLLLIHRPFVPHLKALDKTERTNRVRAGRRNRQRISIKSLIPLLYLAAGVLVNYILKLFYGILTSLSYIPLDEPYGTVCRIQEEFR